MKAKKALRMIIDQGGQTNKSEYGQKLKEEEEEEEEEEEKGEVQVEEVVVLIVIRQMLVGVFVKK